MFIKQEKAISKISTEPMEENASYAAVYFLFLDNWESGSDTSY
ncbi:hypothetical protein [Dysgonomonas sp. HDW5A]|nr:hypothetical protein [Dysgonomonas sp. HDW5A]